MNECEQVSTTEIQGVIGLMMSSNDETTENSMIRRQALQTSRGSQSENERIQSILSEKEFFFEEKIAMEVDLHAFLSGDDRSSMNSTLELQYRNSGSGLELDCHPHRRS
jgi:hypothetical protein